MELSHVKINVERSTRAQEKFRDLCLNVVQIFRSHFMENAFFGIDNRGLGKFNWSKPTSSWSSPKNLRRKCQVDHRISFESNFDNISMRVLDSHYEAIADEYLEFSLTEDCERREEKLSEVKTRSYYIKSRLYRIPLYCWASQHELKTYIYMNKVMHIKEWIVAEAAAAPNH